MPKEIAKYLNSLSRYCILYPMYNIDGENYKRNPKLKMQTEQVFISYPLHLVDTVQPIFCSFVVGLSFERSHVI